MTSLGDILLTAIQIDPDMLMLFAVGVYFEQELFCEALSNLKIYECQN